MMSITLNNSDFQCLQDQLVELKTKNYELAEKNRRSQADFEAAKAKICILQLKLEEQERDFQVTSTTLRREIEALTVASGGDANSGNNGTPTKENNKDEDYKAKYKKLLHKAKELQQRYEKSVEIVQQLEAHSNELKEQNDKLDQENKNLRDELETVRREYQDKLTSAIEEYKTSTGEVVLKTQLDAITCERDELKSEVERLTAEVNQFERRLERLAEERKIHERKGLQIVKDLKRQLALNEQMKTTLSLSSSHDTSNDTNDDTRDDFKDSAKDEGSGDSIKDDTSNDITNNDTTKNDTNDTNDGVSENTNDAVLIEEQAALVKRLTELQHNNWVLEERVSYMEQANSSLSEELANKSDIIKQYFVDQAMKITNSSSIGANNSVNSRRTSFPNNVNQLLSEKPSLKKVVDFLKERSQVSSAESESISREATKKMQLMLEETLMKCFELQKNLDFVTSELNKLKK